MRSKQLIGLTCALLVSACWEGVDGNGVRVDEAKALSGFSAVENRSDLDVSVERGDAFAVVVSIDEDLQELVEVRLVGTTLRVDTSDHIGEHVAGPSVRVIVPSLLALTLDGAGSVDAFGFQESAPVRLRVSGSGDLDYDGSAPQLTALVRGSGSLHVRGTTQRLDADIDGSGDLDARDLLATSASLSVDGSGDLTAFVDGPADARVSGSGDIDIFGKVILGNSSTRGSGDIQLHR